jgi:Xaa-Pro aminopeptidase
VTHGKTSDFARLTRLLPDIQAALAEFGLDGWLLYDLHARNVAANTLLGVGDLTRRYFVLIPRHGPPVAITHGVEEHPWLNWTWERQTYVAWRELDELLRGVLSGRGRVAMEFSERDAVPSVDLVPAGVVELVRSTGVQVISSGDLLTLFYARWTDEDLASHRRASATLGAVADDVFRRLAACVEAGDTLAEGIVRSWVIDELRARSCGAGADCIVATGVNGANPHYSAVGAGARIEKGHIVLLDLWAKEFDDSVYADQTWMGYLGAAVPDRPARIFGIVRDARDAAVQLLQQAWQEERVLHGSDVDDAARNVITDQGYGAFFIHRTGHSIDRSTHGMGPNIDNLETREVRRLVPGIGFSIEPGIYIPDDIGIRSEINVFIGAAGPEVTTPDPQRELRTLLSA